MAGLPASCYTLPLPLPFVGLYESVGPAAQCQELFGRLEDSTSSADPRHRDARHRDPRHRHLICNTEQRVQHLLVSRGPVVRLWIDHATSQRRFLIHYSGNDLPHTCSLRSSNNHFRTLRCRLGSRPI